MNFFASQDFLDALNAVYYPGKAGRVADFVIEDKCFRLLAVGGRVVTSELFFDYCEPISRSEARSPQKRRLFIQSAALGQATMDDWHKVHDGGDARAAPFVDFSKFGSFEEYRSYLQTRSKDRFKKIRRLRERLGQEIGELAFDYDDQDDQVIGTSLSWKSQQLRETGLEDIYERPEQAAFFRELRRRGRLRVSSLRAGGRLLGSSIGYEYEGVGSGWVLTYDHDPALRKYSIGWQLIELMLEECYKRGFKSFDFSVGAADFKFAYGTHVRLVKPFGTRPLGEAVAIRLKRETKLALGRFPKLLDGMRQIARAAKTRF
jgi:hypothetical protein